MTGFYRLHWDGKNYKFWITTLQRKMADLTGFLVEVIKCTGITLPNYPECTGDLLEKGDSVMADRGLNIHDLLALKGENLNIQPFLDGQTQITRKDTGDTW